MRKRKLILNTTTSLLNQLITIICGFILPKVFLNYYGSSVNGLITSITQFLGVIAFLELGVGAVVQSTLYKPLANNDNDEISRIIKSADKFFKKIAIAMILYTIVLMIVYPFITINRFNFFYTSTLIGIISISSFAQYYFGIKYQLLLNADQKSYIQLIIQIITLLINTIITVILIINGLSIHIVKLVTSLIFLIRPLSMYLYIKNHYKINNKVIITTEPIKQKWNGLAQHLAAVVLSNTDVVILTLFSTLENVSIYGVYNLVVVGVKQIIVSLTTGTTALFGNMIAKKETKSLLNSFERFEIIMHFCVSVIFTITSLLIIPFVTIYTKGINDVNYIVPTFAIFITFAQAIYCLRLPYNILILAAGHFKQTQSSAIIEMLINIVISLICVIKFGLVGVALGTLLAMSYRTVYLVLYLRNNIIKRSINKFVRYIFIDILVVLFSNIVCNKFPNEISNYFEWFTLAIKVSLTVVTISMILNILLNYKNFIKYITKR